MYRRLLLTISTVLITTTLFAKEYKLHPRVLRDTSGKLKVEQLSSNSFLFEEHINAGEGDVIWLETALPKTDSRLIVVQFNPETFMKADVYQEQVDSSWSFVGKTGSSYSIAGKDPEKIRSIPTWNQAVVIPLSGSGAAPGKLRIRIEPVKYTPVSISMMSVQEHFKKTTAITFWASIFTGICICITLVIFSGGIFFKDSFYLYISGVTLSLVGHFLCVQGFGAAYFWPWLIASGKAENMIFLFSLAALFCATGALLSDNKRILPVKSPGKVINIVFFICMIIITLQFIVFNQNFIQAPLTIAIILIMALFFYICIKTSFFQTKTDKQLYWLWSFAVFIIITRQIFHVLRAKSNAPVFRIFDNDMDWPVCVSILIITIPTAKNIIVRLRGKIALLEIATAAAEEKTQTANSRSFVYSRVIFSLMNPMTLLINSIESPLSGATEQTRNIARKSSRTMMGLLNALFSLSHYESGIADADANREPVVLLSFLMNAIEEQLKDIKAKGNLPEIKRGMPASTVVFADKILLEILFQYMLEPVRQYALAGTPILIYLDYKNSVLTYSVHITSTPLSEYDARNILDLNYIISQGKTDDKNHFNKIIAGWGIQLHIVKRIVSIYNGSMSILPDPVGNTFFAQFALKQTAPVSLEIETINEEPAKTEQQGEEKSRLPAYRQHALYAETILIIENNSDLQTSLTDMFSQFYKTVNSINGQEAFTLLQNFTPDLIITSDTLPVLSGEELLKFCRKDNRLSSIPFFFMTSFSEAQRRLSLYRSGAVEIIEKPFLPEELLAKVNSFMENRRTVKSLVLSDISNAVRQGLDLTPQEPAHQAKRKQQTHVYTMSGDAVKKVSAVQSNMPIPTSAQMALFTAANLSDREIQIALFISQGMTDKDIAARLDISPSTVAVHNKKIFKKLDIHSRLELISKTM